MFVRILLVSFVVCSISLASELPNLTKCNRDDAKCMKTSAQAFMTTFLAGNPDWGIETLEPFFMKSLDASSANLKLFLKDITGKGLDQCLIKKMQFDSAVSKLFVKAECSVDFQGQYDLDGQISFLKIRGNGHAHVVIRKALLSVDVDIEEVTGKDGLQHWSIKRYTHSYELKDKATIDLENLFDGEETLARVAKDLFASSPNEVIAEVGPPIIKAIIEKVVVTCNRFFKKIALKFLVAN